MRPERKGPVPVLAEALRASGVRLLAAVLVCGTRSSSGTDCASRHPEVHHSPVSEMQIKSF